MTPSAEQLKSLLRTLLKIIGTILTTHGMIAQGTWEPISGAIIMLAPIVWDMMSNSQQGLISKVATMIDDPKSPVQGLIMVATPEGDALAKSVPSSGVVTAGTASADALAKA